MRLRFHQFELPLRHVFTISRGSTAVQPTLIVELQHDGMSGFGEATTNPYYGATLDSMRLALEAVRDDVEQASPTDDPSQLWQHLDDRLQSNRFAQCALDQAAYDLWGKLLGQPVYRLWNLQLNRLPISNFTIGIDSVETMVAKLREQPNWPVYKIKLGGDSDLDVVRALRQETTARFRVDANCGWTAEQTIRYAPELQRLGVEFIEQPLPADDWSGMQRVFADSCLPIIADESCGVESDVVNCAECFHGINIKLVKCGGLTPARRMIAQARRLGCRVMVGCMTESSVGISAIAQLLPLLDYVDMDGALLLAEDIASGVTVHPAGCTYPNENGCGVSLRAANPAD